MMNYPKIGVALALALAGGLVSCHDPLNVAPQQSIDAGTAYNTPQKIEAAVIGTYARLDQPRLYGTDLVLVPELLAGDNYVDWEGTFQSYNQLRRHTQIATNSNAEGIWTQAYDAINQANLVLANTSVVKDADLKSKLEGEVAFIRAAMYFELVRLYARQYEPGGANSQPGVPINLTAITTIEQADVKLARSSVQQVYSQILADLQFAFNKLPAQNTARASKYSAEALLARVYLQQGNYPLARAAAEDVIVNSGASLASSVGVVFTSRNSPESLFEIQQNDQNNAGSSNDGLATFFAGYSPTGDQSVLYGRADVRITGSFAGQYENADVRGTDSLVAITTKKLIYLSDGNNKANHLRSLKWRTYGQNIPVIRLAEMYLIRAEANVRDNRPAQALADLNLVRLRSHASPLRAVTLDDVLRERQLELAFEGCRIHDLRRTNGVIIPAVTSTPTAPAVLATADRFVLPIPQREINNNSRLTQNPGY